MYKKYGSTILIIRFWWLLSKPTQKDS